ncbi:ABC transporter permease subunit [Euzebya tangerina]|uniref:ABC transporter permease subunit n=1 Tax=Euzebya tangerina TaxID=591198 RepID=UPI000E31A638|nr:ABC transporter permease subunit [Euzebya tangerina]
MSTTDTKVDPAGGASRSPGRGSGDGSDPSWLERITGGGSPLVVLLRISLLGLVVYNAVVFTARLVDERAWLALGAMWLATVGLVWLFTRPGRIPAKFIVPGTIFLLVFQIYPVLYTGYIAFTNFGTGNVLDKPTAIEQLQAQATRVPPDAIRYDSTAFADETGALALLLTDPDGEQLFGTSEELTPLDDLGDVTTEGEQVTAVGAFERLSLVDAQEFASELQELRVPTDDGAIQLQSLTTAARAESTRVYDEEQDLVTDTVTGVEYRPVEGNFVSDDGDVLTPGWVAIKGTENFTRAFTSPLIRGPFIRVFIWNYAFAIGSVFLTFVLGLGLALALNEPRMRSRRLYRSLLVIPYALPSFLTALVWTGLLNTEFGAVNGLLGADLPWLTDPWLAKISILLVNLWLGFPYMFLVTTGALQAIPSDMLEAASVDGAGVWQKFSRITLPNLMITVAPLLIASFAFNFNNFNTVYLVTRGGPPIQGAQTPAGHTDILVSYVYRIAFESGRGADYGFAAAIAVLIFIMVAGISAYSFRYTQALEEIA